MALSDNLPATDASLAAILAKSEQQRALIAGIAVDISPVQVIANLISGNGAYSTNGSPSGTASNAIIYSSPFIPNGERIRCRVEAFLTGDRTYALRTSGGSIWLETDLSGGTSFVPILGTAQLFSAIPGTAGSFSSVFDQVPALTNCRFGIAVGTMGGSTGAVGMTFRVRN